MKFSLVVAGLLSLSLSLSATATTLKLSPDIDLMMVDGKKMTGSLLKGADSLELDDGQHQLLFKVTKSVRKDPQTQTPYVSSPLIVVFDSQNVSSVIIELPRIESVRDGKHFDEAPNFSVLDANGKALAIKSDVLPLKSLPDESRLERFIADYNGLDRKASVPALAHLSASAMAAESESNTASQKVITLKGENVSEQMLHYWFLRADRETQKRFINWANKRQPR